MKTKTAKAVYVTLAERTDPDGEQFYKITTPEQLFINALHNFGSDLLYIPPVCEYRFAMPDRHRADFAYLNNRLLIEIDGGTRMIREGKNGGKAVGGRHNTDKDRMKLNLAAVLGFRVLRFSTEMLANDPEQCIDVVRQALQRVVK